jgi:hypothetical protein
MFDEKELIGTLVTVYLNNGSSFDGSIRIWNKNGVKLTSKNGMDIYILDIKSIIAFKCYKKSNGTVVKERSVEDIEPSPIPGDHESLMALREMRAQCDLKAIKEKLLKKENSAEETIYGNELLLFRAIKNDK